jgi:hypothetical protein
LTLINLNYQANREISDRIQDQYIDNTIFHGHQETCSYPKKSAKEQIITLKNKLIGEQQKKSVDWTVLAEDAKKKLYA